MGQRLGQHFLKNELRLKKVEKSLNLKKGDVVVEIGPGHGELTKYLIESDIKLFALERDSEFINPLEEKFKNKIKVIEGSALEILPELVKKEKFKNKQYKIAGNIPYYITGFLFRIIGELKNKPSVCVFTIQKEVAQRACAKKGQMNLLAATIGIWADAKIVDIVPKGDFNPPPKVDSAIISLAIKDENIDLNKYFNMAKILFKQPKKTIVNNIFEAFEKNISKDEIAKKLLLINILENERAHNLDIEQIKQIALLFF